MVEPKGLFQVVNETRMPMTVTVFTQPILSFFSQCVKAKGEKKKKKRVEPKPVLCTQKIKRFTD